MPSLKDYRDRIASVKSTRKITSAMKLVAASKLKKAQDKAQASQPYSERMSEMLDRLLSGVKVNESSPALLSGTGRDKIHLLIVITSDRGLAGGFNSSIVRLARQTVNQLEADGKTVKLICIGRKGRDLLRSTHRDNIIEYFEGPGKQGLSFRDADKVSRMVLDMFAKEEFDVCSMLYNKFRSVIAQIPTTQQMIPFVGTTDTANDDTADAGADVLYEFEPDEEQLLEELLPKNLSIQIFAALLDSSAGEHAARMTAMDNATRNAGDRIDQFTLAYNRARQAYITKELIEIISGAEAL
jgi:F-type H+-transporting ATPase subunit gamma